MSIEQKFKQLMPQLRPLAYQCSIFVLLYNYTVMARREAKKLRAGN